MRADERSVARMWRGVRKDRNLRPKGIMPVVTVVVPVYNRAGLVGDTLRSVEAQTLTDWECVIVDDGSTDETPEIVDAFCARDPRFRSLRQENAGPAAARNHGIAIARGRYIALIDSDDQFVPDRLEWQVAVLDAAPGAVLVYGDTWQFSADDPERGMLCVGADAPPFRGPAFERLLQHSPIYAPLVRAHTIRELGGFNPDLEYSEDWEMWLRLARVGDFIFVPRVATRYRIHAGNRSGLQGGVEAEASLREFQCARRIVREQLRDYPIADRIRLSRRARAFLRRGYTGRLLRDTVAQLRTGHVRQAAEIGGALVALSADRPGLLLRTLLSIGRHKLAPGADASRPPSAGATVRQGGSG